MFRIEAYVEDKRLAEALRALAGLVRGQPSVVPVTNVDEGRTLRAKSNGSLLGMFAEHLVKAKVTQLKPTDVDAFMKSVGRSKASRGHLVKTAIESGVIKRTGKTGSVVYHVVARKG